MVPAGLCLLLVAPDGGEFGNLCGDGGVFDGIGEHTALGEGAEAVVVLTVGDHVAGIHREVGILRGVGTNPGEGLEPGVGAGDAWEFEMGDAGEELALADEHAGVDEDEEDDPAPDSGFEEVLADERAADQGHHDVDEVQVPHGLEGNEADERVRAGDDHGDELLEDAKGEDAPGELGEGFIAAFLCPAGEEPEEDEWGDCAEPLVPLPAIEEEVGAGLDGLAPGFGGAFKDPAEGREGHGCVGEFALLDELGGTVADAVDLGEGEEEAEADAERAHDGVEQEGSEQEGDGDPVAAGHDAVDGEEDEAGGEGAGVEVLIHDVEIGTGDGECEHGAEHGYAGPLGDRGTKESAEDEESGGHDEEDGEALPEEFAPGDGEVGDAEGLRNDLVKGCGLELCLKEWGIMGEKLGLEVVLDGGEVHGIVFCAGVIAHDQEGDR